MADEKVVRISGDATGFGNEINRAARDAKEAFSDIGLEELFDEADRKFDNLSEKIQSVSDELNRKKQEANEFFDRQRDSGAGNDYFQRNVDKEQSDYNKRHEEAIREWEKFVEKLKAELDRVNNNNNPDSNNNNPENDRRRRNENERSGSSNNPFNRASQDIGGALGSLIPGNIGRMLGRGITNLLRLGAERLGAGAEGAGGAGGGAGGAGGGGAGGLAGAGGAAGVSVAVVAGIVVAAVAAFKYLYGKGMDDWRTESKVNTTFDIDRDTFGRGGSDFGLDNVEYKEFILGAAKSRGTAANIQDIARKEMSMMRGYGLTQGEVQSYDKYTYQDVSGKTGTDIIVDILNRSEKQGILGVSQGDFSRLPEKIEQVSSIMSFQKMSGERVDSLSAVNFMAAGDRIGGRFGDDRASEVYGRMNESIKNPTSPGMKAYIFEMMKRANPNASFTDIQAMMENGASSDNLRAILPQISKMPQGEMRRMVLQNLTGGNMQDAIRLDNSGSLTTMLDYLNNKGSNANETQSRYDEAMKRTETNLAALDQLGKVLENKLTDFGEKFIARPINDITRSLMSGDTKGAARNAIPLLAAPAVAQTMLMDALTFGAFSNKDNKVTPKSTH